MANILVVDDALFVRETIRRILEANGHVMVGEAENGREAIQKYEAIKPDIVLLDITMPVVSGLEALKGIKNVDPKAKVIMCSSMGQQDMVAESITYGALDFVIKPFKHDQVITAIDKALAK